MSFLFITFLFAVCLVFCWSQWKIARRYRCFPSKRLDVDWLWRYITGRYPKDVTLPHFFFQELLKTCNSFQEKGLCVLWMVQPRILVFNQNLVKNLMNDADLSDKGPIFDVNKLLFGDGLLTSKHEVWKVHRKLINPAFTVSMLKNNMSTFNKYARDLAEKIDTIVDKPIEDIFDFLKWTSMQNMFGFVLGLNFGVKKLENISKVAMEVVDSIEAMFMERLCRPWVYSDFLLPLFKFGKEYLNLIHKGNHVLQEITDELKTQHFNEGHREMMSCGRIVTKLHQEDGIFSEKDVRDHLLTLAGTGYDTVAVTMMWCLYTLGHHHEVQERAYNEVVSIVPEGDFTYEDLAEMKYLDCVIKETLRLHSTVPIISRRATRDIQCEQYTIPKGTDVWLILFLLHRNPDVFLEPEKFDPDRFSDSSKLRPWMYIPFAEGYRSCIGKRLAMLEIKVQLAHILRRFKITSLNKIGDSDLESVIVLLPTVAPKLLFENRLSTS